MNKISARQIATVAIDYMINTAPNDGHHLHIKAITGFHFGCESTCRKRWHLSSLGNNKAFSSPAIKATRSEIEQAVISMCYSNTHTKDEYRAMKQQRAWFARIVANRILASIAVETEQAAAAVETEQAAAAVETEQAAAAVETEQAAAAVETEQAAAAVETEQAAAAVETEQDKLSDVTAFVHRACHLCRQPIGAYLVESTRCLAANFDPNNFDFANFIISCVNHDDDGLCTEICNEYPEAIVDLCGYAADSLMNLVREIEKGDIFIDDALAALYRKLGPCEQLTELCDYKDIDPERLVFIRLLAVWRDFDECYPYRDIIRILAKGYDRTGVYSTRYLSRSNTARAALLVL